ncbi:hypothetical protein J8L88_10685 [Aquimarina sp. MMG015]|uniref:tetratricopeptide repeat protein n=1 Tax=Aquimarina TaxID=290174 RepID=UPI0003F73C7C|nr:MULTISPECIES: hypothetical protein [Aquimarina]AXT57750.1 hypothetical protein D1815_19060 [Aquimarina sp. AD1]MBQ4803314.1 hypothetical protein [Aquimarina sp. MMG015]RKN29824.1 hypothetical protein D7035_06680 [Aquimarina sp. AD1]
MTPEKKYELFEGKINNELSVEEQEIFSKILEQDKSVAEEFRLYKRWSSYLEANVNADEERADLENNLKSIGESFFEKKQTQKETKVLKIPSWGYAVAASLAILLGVYTFVKTGSSYNDFVSIPELSITERGVDDELIKKAEDAFNSAEYSEAEIHLSELLKNDIDNSEYNFYLGITLVEQDKYKKASEVFGKLQNGKSVYRYKAIWFEALNQLKQGEKDQCKSLLKQLPNEAEDYQKAQELLKQI